MNSRLLLLSIAAVTVLACTKQETRQTQQNVEGTAGTAAQQVEGADDIAVPIGKDDPALREQERFDEGWRGLPGFRDDKTPAVAQGPGAPNVQVQFTLLTASPVSSSSLRTCDVMAASILPG